jgi:SSS family solute:Na+ symporter
MMSFDVFFIIVYLIICIILGFSSKNKIRNIREYTLGNGSIPTLIMVSTTFATAMGASSCIGAIEVIYKKGFLYAVPQFFAFIYWILMSIIFARDLSRFERFISLSEIMSYLYGKFAGFVSSGIIVINAIGTVASQITAIGHLGNYFFGFEYVYGVVGSALVMVIYSFSGGFRAVAITDFFQSLLFFIALPVACGLLIRDFGDINKIVDINSLSNLWNNKEDILFSTGALVYLLIPSISAPYLQRVLAIRQEPKVIFVFRLVALMTFFYTLIIIIMGLILRKQFSDIEPAQGMYFIIKHYLGSYGVGGFFISAILAVAMSTADSWLNVSSSVIAHDIVKKIKPKITKKQELIIARLSTILLAVFAIYFSLLSKEVIEKLWFVRNFWHSIILVPLLAGILGIKARKKSFIFSMIAGIAFTIVGKSIQGKFGVVSLGLGTIASFIVFSFSNLQNGLLIRAKEILVKLVIKVNRNIVLYRQNIRYSDIVTFSFYAFIQSFVFLLLSGHELKFIIFMDNIIRVLVLIALFSITYNFYQLTQKTTNFIYTFSVICFFSMPTAIYLIPYYKIPMVSMYFILSFLVFLYFSNIIVVIFLLFLSYIIRDSVANFTDFSAGLKDIPFFWGSIVNLFFLGMVILQNKKEEKIAAQQDIILGGSIVHDIRGPLHTIRLYLTSLKKHNANQQDSLALIKKIDEATENLVNVTNRFVDYIKGDKKYVLENFDIKSLMLSMKDKEALLPETQGVLSIKVLNNYKIRVDKIIFERAIINMINNSWDALNSKKSKKITIEISIVNNRKQVAIIDNGAGIPETLVNKIFTPLFTTKKSGSGIGLASSKELLHNMGIRTELKSKYGKGTKILLTFK